MFSREHPVSEPEKDRLTDKDELFAKTRPNIQCCVNIRSFTRFCLEQTSVGSIAILFPVLQRAPALAEFACAPFSITPV
jgi:hypothetical protein